MTGEPESTDRSMASPMSGKLLKVAAVLAVLVGVGTLLFSLTGHLDLARILSHREQVQSWTRANPVIAAAAFFAAYVAVTALSLPFATWLTLLAGALFGQWVGVVLALLASVTGASIAMLIARYAFRDAVQRRFGERLRGIEGDGASYLFGLRLVPVVPYVLVNLGMGLTAIPVLTFAWVSLIGMLPATVLYVNAGRQLDTISAPRDILSPRVLLGLLAVAVLPFVAKAVRSWWAGHAARQRWSRPQRFDYNLVVIGAGSAGLVAASMAAGARARVALVEEGRMGGECLNTGCVPSKALIRSAKLAKEGHGPERLGLTGRLEPDFAAIMARIGRVIAAIAPHDSVERYRGLGVDVVHGSARIVDPWTVQVGDRRLAARRIVIATGAGPAMPPIPGIERVAALTSETIWSLRERPGRLLILGGGAIGCELAQAFARLGSRVTLVEATERLLTSEDPELGAAAAEALAGDGVDLVLGIRTDRFDDGDGGRTARLADGRIIPFDQLLVAVGRTPRTTGFGLEELGLLDDGRLVVDRNLRTRLPNIYAAGDVIGQRQFTHAAGQYGWIAAVNALFDVVRSWRSELPAFPAVIYTDPEVARVGKSEAEAKRDGLPYEVTRVELRDLDRAIIDEAPEGFIKVLTAPGKDRILGVAVVGARAGDILGTFTIAMRNGLGLNAVLKTIHPYPGWTEAAKAAALAWRRAHLPGWALGLSARFLRWRRG